MFDAYKNRMAYRGRTMSEMLRMQSNMVIEQTWDRDPNARRVYVVKVNSGLPEVTADDELIDVKFNIKTYQSITSDEVAYMLQFRHGEEKRHPEIDIGSYVYMEDEDMFMVIDDYLNYIFESFYASDRLSKEQLEKNKLMAIKSLLPYKNIKNNSLYVDESSIKLLGTENKKVK